MQHNIVTGIDIGGSHITAALVDLDTQSIIRESLVRERVDSKGEQAQIIREWTAAIARCRSFRTGVLPQIGIAMPGPFDYENGISLIQGLDKFDALYGANVKTLLAQELGNAPGDIFLMNDASCFLKGEVFGGAVKNCREVIGITLGTGLGSAVVREGKLFDGDLYCTPYRDGVAEDYLSTRWFVRRYRGLTGREVKDVKALSQQVPDDAVAQDLFREFGRHLGEVLAAWSRKHRVDTVVIGGNIVQAWELFVPEAEKLLQQQELVISLHRASLGEEAALLGAGSLCR
ncbi:MAG: ROK family protein [Chitinophagaceae bacterium]